MLLETVEARGSFDATWYPGIGAPIVLARVPLARVPLSACYGFLFRPPRVFPSPASWDVAIERHAHAAANPATECAEPATGEARIVNPLSFAASRALNAHGQRRESMPCLRDIP